MLKITTPSGKWDAFCKQIVDFLKADLIDFSIDGTPVRGFRSPDSPALWIRDHSDIMRGGKFIEQDVRSAIDCFAGQQARNGRIFDHVLPGRDHEEWVRVQVEADVEFRFVKAAYIAYQATGDLSWIEGLLPSLDRALIYNMSHPWRWDPQHELLKRPYTIDTWDFDYTAGRYEWLNFEIGDDTFWGITHGDNSGFYESALLLARLYRSTDRDKDAARWEDVAKGIKKRSNQLLFNGSFYTHFYKLTPVTIEGVDEERQLSLSTPMAINRGLATREIAAAILQEYRKRGADSNTFAEWFGIDPPFPDGTFGDDKLVAGAYINGGIFPLVGGELSRAAFEHGFEEYALENLEKYRRLISETGSTYLWYFPDGSPSTVETSTSPDAMPTDGWGSSAMLYALVEGLAGIEDLEHSYRKVRCAPRWVISDEDSASVEVGYAASGQGFSYHFQHFSQDSKICVEFEVDRSDVLLHLLLPPDKRCTAVSWGGKQIDFETNQINESEYIDASGIVEGRAKVEVDYVGY